MTKIKALVVDDEIQNRELITDMIAVHKEFEVVGQADRVKTAIAAIKELKPDVVFLDIRMPDGNGFEVLDEFKQIDFLVVFVSAFDSYALKAFDFNAVDYVLKPIDSLKFGQMIQKLITTFTSKLLLQQEIKEVIEQYDLGSLLIKKLHVHNGNKVVLLPLQDLVYAKADEGTTTFWVASGERYNSSKQLSDFEFIFENFPPLIRITKGVYINTNYIKSYSKGSTCIIFMQDGAEFEVSKRKKTEILNHLQNIKNPSL